MRTASPPPLRHYLAPAQPQGPLWACLGRGGGDPSWGSEAIPQALGGGFGGEVGELRTFCLWNT